MSEGTARLLGDALRSEVLVTSRRPVLFPPTPSLPIPPPLSRWSPGRVLGGGMTLVAAQEAGGNGLLLIVDALGARTISAAATAAAQTPPRNDIEPMSGFCAAKPLLS